LSGGCDVTMLLASPVKSPDDGSGVKSEARINPAIEAYLLYVD